MLLVAWLLLKSLQVFTAKGKQVSYDKELPGEKVKEVDGICLECKEHCGVLTDEDGDQTSECCGGAVHVF